MGICCKCEEPCDGEPYVLLVDGTMIANRQYCGAHAPPLHLMEQKEIGHTLTGAVIEVTVEWVRAGEMLDTPHQFRSPDYKAGWRDGNVASMRSATATTEYDEWNPPDDTTEEEAVAEAEQEGKEREKAEQEKEIAEDYEHRTPDPDDADWDKAHESSDHRND